jgi:hypothetical protein
MTVFMDGELDLEEVYVTYADSYVYEYEYQEHTAPIAATRYEASARF